MYTLKSNRDGTFSLVNSPNPKAKLRSITIRFPSSTSHAGGSTEHYINGPAEVTLSVEHENGEVEKVSNVNIEW